MCEVLHGRLSQHAVVAAGQLERQSTAVGARSRTRSRHERNDFSLTVTTAAMTPMKRLSSMYVVNSTWVVIEQAGARAGADSDKRRRRQQQQGQGQRTGSSALVMKPRT